MHRTAYLPYQHRMEGILSSPVLWAGRELLFPARGGVPFC